MMIARSTLAVVLVALLGCAGHSAGSEDVGQVGEALDVCSETVPANRNVDGIPAYAQCAAAQNSAIYSDNGVDTSTSSMGSGWVRTQYNAGYQCTEFAYRYLHFRWNIVWEPNGNAGTWCDATPPSGSGVVQASTPSHGDLIVFAPGTCGSDPVAGHVAVVDTVSGTSSVTAVEQNQAARSQYKLSCAKCFLHVVANSGPDASSPSGGSDASSGRATDAMTAAPPTVDGMAPLEDDAAQPPEAAVGDDGGTFAPSDDAESPDAGASAQDAESNSDMPVTWGGPSGAGKGCSTSGERVPRGDESASLVLCGVALAGAWVRSRHRRSP